MHRELRGIAACRGQSAEQEAVGGPLGQFGQELGQLGRLGFGMDQRGARLPAARAGRRQRRHAGENAVMLGRQITQQNGQCRLVPVFGLVGTNAHTGGACPVGHRGQFGTHMVQDGLCLTGVVVGDVGQPQPGRAGIVGQGHLRAQLGDGQTCGHAPLWVRGMTAGKELHGREARAFLAAGFLLEAFLDAARAAGFALALVAAAVGGGAASCAFMAWAATSCMAAEAMF